MQEGRNIINGIDQNLPVVFHLERDVPREVFWPRTHSQVVFDLKKVSTILPTSLTSNSPSLMRKVIKFRNDAHKRPSCFEIITVILGYLFGENSP